MASKLFTPNEEILLKAGETLVVDFGQSSSAVPSFIFKAAKGTTLTCLTGESEAIRDKSGTYKIIR